MSSVTGPTEEDTIPSTDTTKGTILNAALFEGDPLWDASSWKECAGEITLRRRMNSTSNPQFILYSSWFCPFAQRAWIAAEESGVDYQWMEINPYYVDPTKPGGYCKKAKTLDEKKQDCPEFVDASPRGLVPALRREMEDDSGTKTSIVLWESLPVSEYIDAVFGGGRLVDRNDPYQVARQQIWCAHCTDRLQKKFYQALVSQDKAMEKVYVEEFYEECRTLARAMKTDGPYFDGSKFSLVDVALAPFWQRILSVGPFFFGLTLPSEEPEFQRLEHWWNAVSSRPSVAATIVCEPRLVSTYSDYARNEATSDAARNYMR